MYRHPNTPSVVFECIQDVLNTICMKNKTVYALGDFNDNLLANNNKMNTIKSNKLTQLVNKPTRVTPTSSTLIDLIITNKPDTVSSCDVVPQEIANHVSQRDSLLFVLFVTLVIIRMTPFVQVSYKAYTVLTGFY